MRISDWSSDVCSSDLDVMDEPALLAPEWERKQVVPALQRYFDDIWVYGLPQICDPLEGIELPDSVRKRMTYTGYLRRTLPKLRAHVVLEKISDPFLLVTVGGGGDGEAIIDWVLREIGRASCRERVCQYV